MEEAARATAEGREGRPRGRRERRWSGSRPPTAPDRPPLCGVEVSPREAGKESVGLATARLGNTRRLRHAGKPERLERRAWV